MIKKKTSNLKKQSTNPLDHACFHNKTKKNNKAIRRGVKGNVDRKKGFRRIKADDFSFFFFFLFLIAETTKQDE